MVVEPLLHGRQARWLVTGAAGFIGSHLAESLLLAGQHVTGVDNFATGKRANIDAIRDALDSEARGRLRFVEGDLCDLGVARDALQEVDYVLHQAAIGSVPRSIENPLLSFAANVDGFVKLLTAAKDAGVKSVVYASSSSVYGDNPAMPKVEARTGNVLSPYAATKAADELFAAVYSRCYGMKATGLRYFNVFGARQDPDGAYAAVIPKWIAALLKGEQVYINGDGETSRDFCYIDNVVQANVRAALANAGVAGHGVFNIAVGQRTTLNELFQLLQSQLATFRAGIADARPAYREFRAGDVKHSLADIGEARSHLGYEPTHDIRDGLKLALEWYVRNSGSIRP